MARISVGDIYTDGFDVYLSGLDSSKKDGYQFDDRTVEWCIGSKTYEWHLQRTGKGGRRSDSGTV